MERLCSLLFELSNEDRLGILLQLDRKATTITNLAKELKLTIRRLVDTYLDSIRLG